VSILQQAPGAERFLRLGPEARLESSAVSGYLQGVAVREPTGKLSHRITHPRADSLQLDPAAAPQSIAPPESEVPLADPGASREEAWTSTGAAGVVATIPGGIAVPVRASFRRLSLRAVALVLIASVSLLGQGERCRVDSRFASPSSTLKTFWDAMAAGNAEDVWECFVEGRHDLPVPGMLWFLPPTERISLAEFRSLPVASGRVLVTYEVRFVPAGEEEESSFRTGDELVRVRGQWRIARPIGQASMPELRLPPRTVDI